MQMTKEETIVYNLKELHQGKWVNFFCATRDVPLVDTFDTINALVLEGIVDVKKVPVIENDRVTFLRLYRYGVRKR